MYVQFCSNTMPVSFPDVSYDFPNLIRTIASLEKSEFDYWDDLVMGIYKSSRENKSKLKSYFKKTNWIHLDKPYPSCPELTNDWSFIKDRYVTRVTGTRYRVEKNALHSGPLKQYAENKKIPNLLAH